MDIQKDPIHPRVCKLLTEVFKWSKALPNVYVKWSLDLKEFVVVHGEKRIECFFYLRLCEFWCYQSYFLLYNIVHCVEEKKSPCEYILWTHLLFWRYFTVNSLEAVLRAANRILLEMNKLPLLMVSISWLLQRSLIVITNARNGIKRNRRNYTSIVLKCIRPDIRTLMAAC